MFTSSDIVLRSDIDHHIHIDHHCSHLHNRNDGAHDDGARDVRDGGDHDHSIHILLPLLQGVLQHWAYF